MGKLRDKGLTYDKVMKSGALQQATLEIALIADGRA